MSGLKTFWKQGDGSRPSVGSFYRPLLCVFWPHGRGPFVVLCFAWGSLNELLSGVDMSFPQQFNSPIYLDVHRHLPTPLPPKDESLLLKKRIFSSKEDQTVKKAHAPSMHPLLPFSPRDTLMHQKPGRMEKLYWWKLQFEVEQLVYKTTMYIFIKSTTMYVPSSELGLSQLLSRQRVCPSPRNQRGGGGVHACGWRVVGVPIPTTGEKLSTSAYSVYKTMGHSCTILKLSHVLIVRASIFLFSTTSVFVTVTLMLGRGGRGELWPLLPVRSFLY
jgi:hypothetical protein